MLDFLYCESSMIPPSITRMGKGGLSHWVHLCGTTHRSPNNLLITA